jgi:hypothetical protein
LKANGIVSSLKELRDFEVSQYSYETFLPLRTAFILSNSDSFAKLKTEIEKI